MSKLVMSAVSSAMLAALAVPAGATHEGVHPTFRPETAYFHCTGTTKLSNVNNAVADSVPTSWNTTPPTQSMQAGAGCAAVDVALVRNTGQVDGFFRGTFIGNLRDLTLRVYSLLLTQARAASPLNVKVSRLFVDGALYVDNKAVPVTVVKTPNGLAELAEVSVTGLGSATEVRDAEGKVTDVVTTGLATEDGDGSETHEITVYLDIDPSEVNAAWAWDATEVPSGIVFNPPALAAARIAATPPA